MINLKEMRNVFQDNTSNKAKAQERRQCCFDLFI